MILGNPYFDSCLSRIGTVCECSKDKLIKANLVSFLITANYTGMSEMLPAKMLST